MAQIIAKVGNLTGEAFARDAAGNSRRLKSGDVIREGETVAASNGAQVQLKMADGREMTVRPGETAKMDAEVAAEIKPDAADSAVTNNPKEFQKIAKAISSGGDLDALLEDPAAGAAGAGGEEGHSFIELLRIVENVDPLAFQFGTGRGRVLDTIEGGAGRPIVPPEIPPETENVLSSGSEDTFVLVALKGSDADGIVVGYVISSLPENGKLYSDAAMTQLVAVGETVKGPVYFKPNPNWNGVTTFLYASVDDDGKIDTTPATATINVVSVNDPVDLSIPDTNGLTVGDVSVPEDGTLSGQTFTISAPDGLDPTAALTIAGTPVSKADLENSGTVNVSITTPQGVMTITGYNPTTGVVTYSYDPSGTAKDHTGGNVLDTISIVVKDDDGDTQSSNLVINITDTAPLANPDTNAITEDAASNTVGGNVVTTGAGTDTLGADAATVTGVSVGNQPAGVTGNVGSDVTGTYGKVTIAADGTYTYTLDNGSPLVQALNAGQSVTDTFTYTLTDADGNASTATLIITVNGTNDGVTLTVPDTNGLTVGDVSVPEDGTLSGQTFTISAPDGLDPTAALTIAGTPVSKADLENSGTVNVSITTPQGVMTITGYNPTTGVVTYSYDPSGTAKDHTGGNVLDTISIVVKDDDGDTQSSNLVINITDTAPLANPDTNAITEDAASNTVGGNVVTTGAGTDTLGADAATVTGVSVGNQPAGVTGNVGSDVTGTYGKVTIAADGTYTYTLDNGSPLVQALNAGQSVTDTFTYTLTDADGNASTTTLIITVNGTNDGVTLTVPDTNGLTVGDVSVPEDGTLSGQTFTISAPDGLDPTAALTIAGTPVSKADLENSGTVNVSITTPQGVMTITGYNPTTGVVTYSYDPSGTAKDHTGGNVLDTISIVVKDDDGDTQSSNLVINITDTAPLANPDTNAITEDAASNTVGGNVVTTGAGTDTLGADAATVTGVSVGNQPAGVTGNVGSDVTGTYGKVTIAADGTYTYTLDNGSPLVQALNAGQSVTDTFTYTLTDADGNASTATLIITVNGTNDGVTLTVPDTNGLTVGDVSVPEDGTLSGQTFTISAPDGLDPTAALTIAGTPVSKADLENSGTVNVSITTPQGVMTITGYNPTTGVVTYSYDPSGTAKDHTGGNVLDTISIVVKDDDGDTQSSNLVINITDTAPLANPDTNAITEDAASNTVGGNVVTTGAGTDTLGADAATVTGVSVGNQPAGVTGNVGSDVTGTYGKVTIAADGTYTYTLDNGSPLVQALNAGQSVTDTFTYTLTDADGNASTTTLIITVNGTNDGVTLTVPDTNGLTVGDVSVPEDGTLSGQTFTISAPDGLDPTAALTIAGTPVSKADLENSGTVNVSITTPQGVMTITGYNPTTGVVTYSYDPSGTAKDHTGGNVLDTISIVVKDDDGDTQSSNLVINITDTAPLANPDTNAITEDAASNTVGGNVVTTGAGTDTLGADAATVTGVSVGNQPAGVTGNVGSDVTGTYGKVTIAADGTYTYTLDNGSPLVQALNAGQSVTDTFTYTLTDADGNASTTTLIITVNGTNDGVTLTVPDTNGLTVGDVSVPEDGTLSGQTFTISAPDGLDPTAALTIAGTPVSKADLENSGTVNVSITTPQGVMTITGYNPTTGVVTYSYDPSGTAKDHTGGNVLDTISIVVKDDDGDTQSSNLVINITDTAPLANPDTNAITEDAASNTVGGNVVTTGAGTDTLGADAATVTGVSVGNQPAGVTGNVGSDVTGTYGKVTIAADGTYTYTLDNGSPLVQALNAGQSVTDTFTYTLTDADGNASTTTLIITVNGTNDGVTLTVPDTNGLTVGDVSVPEDGTLSGQTFTISAPDGLDPTAALTIAGTPVSKADLENSGTVNVSITTPQGVMTITGYNPTTGVVTYSYDPSGTAKDHTGGNVLDTISIVVKDDDGDTQSSNLVINITDTAPLANPDTNAITEDAASNTVGGNVVTTGAGTDTLGADAATVTGVSVGNQPAGVTGNVGSDVTGTYGKVTIAADGTYTYTLDNGSPLVQALNAGQSVTDTFTYTLTDADGNASTATLIITVNGTNDGVTLTVPDTNGLTVGDVSVPEDGTLSGQTFTISAPDGLDPTAALTIAGTPVSKADLENSGTVNVSITTPQGVMTITGYNPTTGVVTYSYDPSGTAKDHTGGNVLDTISIVVKDDDGDTQSSNLVINITDTAPLANPDTNAITEDAASNTVGGNVVTTGAGTDTLGADAATVTGVSVGNQPAGVTGNVGSDVTGTYGKVTIAADGTYTYTLDNGSPLVQALNAGQSVTDTFTYTLTDADGNASTTTLIITVNGTNDGVTLTVPDTNGLTVGDVSVPEDGTLSGQTFTISAPDGLDPTAALTIAGTPVSKADLENSGTVNVSITTPQGVMTITGYNPTTGVVTYSYDPSGTAKDHTGGNVLDTISIVVKDDDGDTQSSNLVINITDTAPLANPDTNAITEDAASNTVGGNVVTTGAGTDTLGADAATVTGVSVGNQPAGVTGNVGSDVTGTYGKVTIAADGTYTYTLDNGSPLVQALNAGQSVTDTFTYTLTDADGNASTTTLIITVNGTNDGVTLTVPDTNGLTVGDVSVPEDGTLSGQTFTISAPDGLDPTAALTIAGTPVSKADLENSGTVNVSITTPQGVMTITGYNPTTGVVTYSYDPSGTAKDHTGGNVLDTISIVVKDDDGDTQSSNLVINITDTAPLANPDTNAITEDAASNTVGGNVVTTGAGTDTLGADAATVTGVSVGNQPAGVTGNVGSDVTGTYGKVTIAADGTYTYTLDNGSPLVQALNAGQSVTDTFTYTLTDADGNASTTTLIITVNGTNDGVTLTVPDTNGLTVGDVSVPEDGTLSGQTFTISAPDGLDPTAALTIAGTPVSKADLENSGTVNVSITTPQGVMTITGYNPTTGVVTYSYDPSGTAKDHTGGNVLDTISIVVKDDDGDTQSSNLVINITDTAPLANPDTNAITEDAASNTVGGNVVTTGAGTDTLGADAATVTGVSVGNQPAGVTGNVGSDVTGTYGKVTIAADGTYTYTLDNGSPLVQALNAGQSVTDTFTYTLTDADGNASTATLIITVNGTNDGVTLTVPDTNGLTVGDVSVPEDGTLSGQTFTISAPDGLDPTAALTIAGTPVSKADLENSGTVNVSITTPQGVMTITGYNPTTGVVTYSYDPSGTAKDHTGGNVLDTISIVVKDDDGDTQSSNLVINITDTAPLANPDTNAITEDAASNTVGGNVVTTGAGTDTLGADAATVTGVSVGNQPAGVTGNVGSDVTGTYGKVTIAADGTYTYTLDNGSPLVQALNAGQSVTDTFTYTLTDADGNASTTTLIITVNGTNDGVTLTVPDTNGLTVGDVSVPEDGTLSGQTFTISAPDGLDPTAALTIAGTPVSKADLENSGTVNVSITTPQGVMTITGYNPTTGVVTYSYDPSGTAKDHTGGNVLDTISIVVKDDDGDTQSSNLVINITDTAPLANPDTNAITEDAASNTVGGNVVTTGAGTDTLGADAATVTGVSVGNQPAGVTGNVGSDVTGTYGKVTIAADGTYTYTLDNGSPLVQALNAGQSVTDTFTYTLTDADGNASTTTLIITVNGTNDGVTLTVPDTNGLTVGDVSVPEDGTLSGQTFTISAPDGLDPTAALTIAGTPVSKADLENSGTVNVSITTPQGVMTITGYNPTTGVVTYSYDPSGTAKDHTGGNVLDTISIVVKDDDGDTQSSNLVINITDTAPLANPDTNAITEDAASNTVGGNVVTTGAGTDTLGADAATVTGVSVGNQPAGVTGNVGSDVTGTYGKVTIAADGTYTYTLDNGSPLVQALNAGQSVTDTFTYTLTDADGNASTTTLIITVNGTNDGVTLTVPDTNGLTVGDVSVPEDGTLSGQTFTISAPDGLDPTAALTIAGTPVSKADLENSGTVNVSITTPQGVMTITGYNPTTGVVTYSYDPSGTAKDHTGGNVLDTISIVVKDDDGDTQSSNLVINITDTAPLANPDTNAITEDAASNTVGGNVVTTGAGTDTLGADAATVTGVSVGNQPAGVTGNVGSDVTGTYGKVTIAADGTYTYTLDNGSPLVQALNAGQSVTDTFTYTLTDADGNASTTTLIITVNGTNDGVTLTVPDTNGLTVGDVSVPEDGTLSGQTFTISAPDGLDPTAALTIAGTPVSKADLENSGTVNVSITTPQGVMTITGYNPTTGVVTYSYDPSGTAKDHTGGNVLDTISIVVKDDDGDTQSSNLVINITDTAPLANPDTNAITEDAASNTVGGNVVTTGAGTDTLGADAATVTGVSVGNQPAGVTGNVGSDVTGTYGKVTIAADGTYTYTLDNGSPLVQALNAGQSVTDTFTYTLTDADGNASTATLIITVNGTNDGVTLTVPDTNGLTVGDVSVPEDGTLSGQTFTISAPDGLDPTAALTIAGTPVSKADLENSGTVNVSITTPQGVMTITGYNPTTGVVTYSYDPSGTAKDHTGGNVLDTISIVVKDDDGDTQSSNLVINITDTAPLANPDTNAITEDAASNTVGGNVVTTGAGTDTLGADAATVTGVSVGNQPAGVTGNVGSDVTGTYGKVTIAADGTYTYTLDNGSPLVQALNAGQSVTDTFTYTLTDADGNASTATLIITVNGTNDGVTLTVPDTNGLTVGDVSVPEDGTLSGQTFTISAPDGLDPTAALTIAGTPVSKADLENSGTVNVSITTPQGVMTITGYNPTTGVVTYSYDPSGTAKDHTGGNVLDTISIVVKDDDGDTQSSNLVINITDTAPLANPDTNAITEDAASNTVGGNVVTTGAGTDTLGADAATVTGVSVGNQPAGVTGNVGSDVTGTYGKVTIAADGTYTYTLDNGSPLVQALARNQVATDVFTYTVTDADGDTSTTTLTVTVTGTNDAPDIMVGAGDSSNASLTETNAGLTANGTLSIFDVDTQDTVTPTVTGVTAIYAGPGTLPVTLTSAQLLAMFSVTGGDPSTVGQGVANGIGWNFNSGLQAFDFLPAGQTLTLTYNVRATDSSGAANRTDNQPVTITITGTNDGVVANADVRVIAENANASGRSGNVLTNDVLDPDLGQTTSVSGFSLDHNGDGIPTTFAPGASVTVTSASGGTLGVFTLAANGAYSFTPQVANYSGPVPVITYTATSTGGDNATSTLSINVTPVSDAPGVTRDAATVIANEDTAVALGLNAPTVSDLIDQTGAATGDNPERLGLISLTGVPSGVRLLDATNGDVALFTATGGTITIRLSDATNLIALPGPATLTMTTAQFEALKLLPAAHSATNFTVTMRVTEYEVDNAGTPLSGVVGVASTTTVVNNVLAVTDPIDLLIAGGNGPHNVTINEDASLNLSSLLSASFQDLDGSERRDIIIANPLGNGIIYVNGNAVAAGSSYTIAWNATGNNLETSQTGFPAISITTGANFSGDLNGITVTLSARDFDSDSPTATPATLTDSVTLNLHVNPVAGDVTLAPVSTPEDSGTRFLNALALTDNDGSEAITGITVNAVPTGWVIRDEAGVVVFTGNGAVAYIVPAGEVTNGDFRNYTITPPAHDSADRTLAIAVQTTDTRIVNGAPVTSTVVNTLSQTITVTAVAETIGSDSNADGTPDLTMNPSFVYTSAGKEDQWFTLNRDSFDLKTPWSNQDADGSEKTFALLTPSMNGSPAIGAQFKYTDGGGAHVLTFNGTALQIPMSALDTVEFKAPSNVAGTFSIGVQALTIDTDPNTGASVQAISGSATLSNLVIEPVADPLTLAVNAPAVGLEDSAIPLVIRPYSADPSETFTVTISGIPAGAKIYYGGLLLDSSSGSVSIADFSKATSLTITPPPNSNVDIPLTVSAVSVDTVGGVTSTSGAATLPLLVDVRGVADPVTLTVQSPLVTTEAAVDGGNQRISLSSVISAVTPADADGSESVALVISGVSAGYTLEGLTFMGGVGAARIWSGSAAEVAGAKLVVLDANFSGTVHFNVRAVSTENDGNSLSGAIVPVTIEVVPSPEATLTAQTTALEDTLTQVNFAIQIQNGDNNETLNSLWINAADLAGKPFTLFLGGTPLSAALVADGGWYKLSAAQAGNVFVKGSANSDADASFAIKYEIRDPSNDGSLPATVTQFDTSYTVNVTAVTDATASSNNYAGGTIAGTTTIDINVTVTQQNDANAGSTPDIDGSERLLYFIIDNVPVGVTVEGGRYIGNTLGNPNTGRWILDTPDVAFNSSSLNQNVRFALDGTSTQLSGLNQQISITAYTQDASAAERTSTTTWTLQTAAIFDDSSAPTPTNPAANISHWVQDAAPVAMVEDAPTALSGLVDAQISGNSPYAITLTGLPAGTVVTGMLLTVVGGQNVWTAQGSGDNASLQALLGSISITPPANWNANQGSFGFASTLTTYDNAGTRHDASLNITPAVTPVSDPIVLTATDSDVAEDSAASITLSLSNPADGASSQVVNGKVYISLNESGMEAGGALSFNGSPLIATAVAGVAGIPNGNYYVLSGVSSNATLGLSYQPAANASGIVSYTAYVQGQETGATNIATSSVNGSFAVNPVNDGVSISAPVASGVEDQRVQLSISATLIDAGEVVSSVTLTNVPDGFLVFAGNGSPGSMAANLGGGVWGIPLVAGALPAYVAIQPPKNWSGTVSNIEVGVWSGEAGQDPLLTTVMQSLTVNGVADGISITPTLSFGNEGQIVDLNLNSSMPDQDGSELAALTIKGLGAHAAFFAGTSLLSAIYDSGTDTYSLSGLTPAQVADLGVIQKDGSYNLTVTAHTVDSPGSSTSATVSANLALEISPVAATAGDDRLLYDGGALNGLGGVDTIEFRLGENLDFSTSPVKPSNIEQFDLMPVGQNHSIAHLSALDVLDMTSTGKSLTILGDSGDSVSLKSTVGASWTASGSQTVGGHSFDVYVNSQDAAIKVLIEQQINKSIDP